MALLKTEGHCFQLIRINPSGGEALQDTLKPDGTRCFQLIRINPSGGGCKLWYTHRKIVMVSN